MKRTLVMTLLLAVWASVPLRAQPPEPRPEKGEGGAKEVAKKVMAAFQKPLHPIVKGVAPGGWFGAGIGYKTDRKGGELWSMSSQAVVTLMKYWNAEGTVQYQGDALHAEFYGRAREMTRLPFYGIGAGTSEDAKTSFLFGDRTAGALASVRLPGFDVIALGGRTEALWPRIGRGRDPSEPSIEERFTEAGAPGLTSQPHFTAVTGFVHVNYPGGNALGKHGVDAHAAYSRYQDRGNGQYSFSRINLESQQRVPGIRPSHTITFHQWMSTTSTEDGRAVPFYLQHTLGGNSAVRSFSEEIIGSDGTKATLRGFRDLRFRAPHLLLLQAEYRFKIKGPVDATVFTDAGTVAGRRSDIRLGDMNTDVGFSVSLMTIDATALRLDVGGGGGEGVRVFFSVGPIFQR